MGGNIFKDEHKVVRLSSKEYFEMVEEILPLLAKTETGVEYHPVQAVYEKSDYGDMDIIVNTDDPDIKQKHVDALTALNLPVSRNGEVISFLYKQFQIDLIFVSPISHEYSKNYFSWNDLGNLIGRLSKKLGFKHGHQGLMYVQRDGDVVLKNHMLSYDYLTIVKILELDVEKFKQGFNNTLEMFEWLSKSPYFDPEVFKFENLNHINRVRDRKRKVYNDFLNWCLSFERPADVVVKEPPLKHLREKFVLELFPEFKSEVYTLYLDVAIKRAVAQKFNGKVVMKLVPELSGKELGGFLEYYKQSVDMFIPYVLNVKQEELEEDILKTYQEYITREI